MTPSSRHPLALRPALLLTGLLLTAAASVHAAGGTSTCPGSPNLARAVPGVQAVKPLTPGSTRQTRGDNEINSPQLAGEWRDEEVPFSFSGPSGSISGIFYQSLVNADDATCDCVWRVRLNPWSAPGVRVTAVQVSRFNHPKRGLFANYRDDLIPGGVPSVSATRSTGDGSTIRFRFEAGVGPGESSRPLYLDTQRDAVLATGQIVLRTSDGGQWLIPTNAWVPAP